MRAVLSVTLCLLFSLCLLSMMRRVAAFQTVSRLRFPVRTSPYRLASRGSFSVPSRLYCASVSLSVSASPSEDALLGHLSLPGSQISPYWLEQLRRIDRPAAKSLIPQLVADNPLGFDPAASARTPAAASPSVSVSPSARQGTLLEYTIAQKRKHPDKVILIRSGEFYETYGVDALMLIAHAGLNPMGLKCKAGCPAKNVQATLDALTAAGLSVAVYEELPERESAAPAKAKIKSRALTQIVSPAASTYIYDLSLRADDIDFRENRPVVGIARTTQGFVLSQIYLDERAIVISERLTAEAVRSLLAASSAIDPLFLQDCSLSDLPFLAQTHNTQAVQRMSGYSERDFPQQMLLRVSRLLEIPEEEVQRFRVVRSVHGEDESLSHSQSQSSPHSATTQAHTPARRPRPLSTSTALQIGLLPNEHVPDLIPHLLPATHTHGALAAKFLRQWIMHPPPPRIADRMQRLCRSLSETKQALPSFTAISAGKAVSLLSAKQGNVALFRDIAQNVKSLSSLLEVLVRSPHAPQKGEREEEELREIVSCVLDIAAFNSGLASSPENLLRSCRRISSSVNAVIAEAEEEDVISRDASARIPDEFFRRNEEEFRNKISLTHPALTSLYAEIDAAAKKLCEVVEREIPQGVEIVHDMFENALMIKEKPVPAKKVESGSEDSAIVSSDTTADTVTAVPTTNGKKKRTAAPKPVVVAVPGVEYIAYQDRRGQVSSRRYTTPALSAALADYLSLTAAAPQRVSAILQALSADLSQEIVSIVQTLYCALVLQTIKAHCVAAKQKGWTLPALQGFEGTHNHHNSSSSSSTSSHSGPSSAIAERSSSFSARPVVSVHDLVPYWLSREVSLPNSFVLPGLFLLTAPNMSGKSTLLRSLLVAALLANSGLFAPCLSSSTFPRFDFFSLRTASFDIPAEAKSAFALEMDDMRVILRDCGARSLVLVDELGKGTSAREGAALTGALLEHFDEKRVYGVFATHLHELFLLPLRLKHVQEKKMGFTIVPPGDKVKWTYKLEDGRCMDSMALSTAKAFNIDASILNRADRLLHEFDAHCRPQRENSNGSSPLKDESIANFGHDSLSSLPSEYQDVLINKSQDTLIPKPAQPFNFMKTIIPILREIEGVPTDSASIVNIPVGHEPPPSLEGQSAVYLLHVHKRNKPMTGSPSSVGVFYVGETESLHQRLRQHRQFYKRGDCVVSCIAFNVPNKSTARALETQLIRELKNKGFPFDRDSDASHSLFSRAL